MTRVCSLGASITRNCRSLVLVSRGFRSKWHSVPNGALWETQCAMQAGLLEGLLECE